MSKLLARIAGLLSNKTLLGVDKAWIDTSLEKKRSMVSLMKEKRWVALKGEDDPTSILDKLIEWICWLNGQCKRAPTPEEMADLEARCELVKQNVARLKKEEEEKKAREGGSRRSPSTSEVAGPDLNSFIRQFPSASGGGKESGSEKDDAEPQPKANRGWCILQARDMATTNMITVS